jgi:hypothetical protein
MGCQSRLECATLPTATAAARLLLTKLGADVPDSDAAKKFKVTFDHSFQSKIFSSGASCSQPTALRLTRASRIHAYAG